MASHLYLQVVVFFVCLPREHSVNYLGYLCTKLISLAVVAGAYTVLILRRRHTRSGLVHVLWFFNSLQ